MCCDGENRRTCIIFGTIFVSLLFVTKIDGIFKITKVECLSLDETLANFTQCQLKPIRRDVAAFSFRLKLLKPAKTIIVYTEVLRKYNTYKPFLLNTSFDACGFFKQSKRVTYPNMLYSLIKEFTNFNHSCPYEGEIILDRLTPLHSDLKLPLFTGDYLVKSRYVFSGVKAVALNAWFTYRELEKWELF